MEKTFAVAILAILEILDWAFGEELFGHLTEESIGIVIAALMPIIVWFIPNRGYGRG